MIETYRNKINNLEAREEEKSTSEKIKAAVRTIVEGSLGLKKGETILICFPPRIGYEMALEAEVVAREIGANVLVRPFEAGDDHFETFILAESLDGDRDVEDFEKLLSGMAADKRNDVEAADAVFLIRSTAFVDFLTPKERSSVPDLLSTEQYQQYKAVMTGEGSPRKIRVKERRWCITYALTQADAQLEHMSLEDLQDVVLRAIDRPNNEVFEAQAEIISVLQKAQRVRITAGTPNDVEGDWSVDVSFSIDGKIGANSTDVRNSPGSEIFLAPDKGTLSGQYNVPYRVNFKGIGIFPNLKMQFVDGGLKKNKDGTYQISTVVTEEHALQAGVDRETYEVELNEKLQKLVSLQGASVVGEWGIGTNPVLNRPFLNSLLVEKVGGSIHFALGSAYGDALGKGNYLGQEVVYGNGNKSTEHHDITRLLSLGYGGGKIELFGGEYGEEGVVLQENGMFNEQLLTNARVLNDPNFKSKSM